MEGEHDNDLERTGFFRESHAKMSVPYNNEHRKKNAESLALGVLVEWERYHDSF
jgi:hypothetical protein